MANMNTKGIGPGAEARMAKDSTGGSQGIKSKAPRPPRKGPGGRHAGLMPGEKAKDFKGTMMRLLTYLAPFKLRIVLVFLATIISTIFFIIAPNVLGNATDTVVTGVMSDGIDFDAVGRILLILAAIYTLSFIFSWAEGWIMAGVSQKITYNLRDAMSDKLDRLPLKYFDTKTNGEIQSRFTNDVETLNQSLSQSLTQIITSVITLIGIIIMMFSINWIMTVVVLLSLPASLLVIKMVVSRSQKHFKNQQEYLGNANGHVEEMFNGHVIVQAFNREEKSIETFDEINNNLYNSAWKSQFLSGMMHPLTGLVGNLAYVIICIVGGKLALAGTVSIGNIQAFIQYIRNFNEPITMLAQVMNVLQSTAAAAERIFEVLDEEEETESFTAEDAQAAKDKLAIDDEQAAKDKLTIEDMQAADDESPAEGFTQVHLDLANFTGEIVFDHVTFGYGDEIIIKDFSYTVKPGERIAIVGPTGAGKTTLVKLLLRFYELNSGRILIDGIDIRSYSRKDLRDMFGMVLQDTWLYSGTVMENIRYGNMNATDEQVMDAAKAAHIDHFIMTQPKGYDMLINEEATNISQGQKQLLTIARALLADNPIMILDEATSSVDTRTESLIQQAMATLMKDRTSFIIAHRLSTIKDADDILVINEGDIVEHGTHNELLAKDGFYAKLYNSQF
ncbi:MAG TPA: ABC transporter ATP-binding protein [Anaerovoracaceae bacterium]|nr:ABC transporter ATP-binding protein [Anaerovoracaceae bacterium]